MPITEILILLGTGLGIGFISGLLGIGGGIIMTPVQYWLYTSTGVAPDTATKMAFATTLAVVLPTVASGVWQYQKRGGVYWKAAFFMGSISFICSFIGAWVASNLISGSVLKITFGAIALVIAIRMLTVKVSEAPLPIRENRWLWFAMALPVGIITGILGIGGGIIVVPLLILVLRFKVHDAIATSLGIMLFSAAGGILGWTITGLHVADLPAHTLGYIYWPAWITLAVTSILMAQAGAIAAHKIPGKQLTYFFMALVLAAGLYMLGVFNWIFGIL
jgi:uncharacterized membrane protein YfcA